MRCVRRVVASFVCHFHEREILSDQNQYEKAQEERRGKLERGGRERVLPTRDQHRREIASNLWVRLITRECSSFDSPLFLRPQLHQTSFQRWEEWLLLFRHLFLYRLNSSLLAPLCERLCVWTFILILRLLSCVLITSFFCEMIYLSWYLYTWKNIMYIMLSIGNIRTSTSQ